MIRPHPYTLHKTYTGPGCAMCGKFYDTEMHESFAHWSVDGQIIPQEKDPHDSEVQFPQSR